MYHLWLSNSSDKVTLCSVYELYSLVLMSWFCDVPEVPNDYYKVTFCRIHELRTLISVVYPPRSLRFSAAGGVTYPALSAEVMAGNDPSQTSSLHLQRRKI